MEGKGESLVAPVLSGGTSETTQSLDGAQLALKPKLQPSPLEHQEHSLPGDRATVVIMPDGNIVPLSSAAAPLPSVHRTADIGSVERPYQLTLQSYSGANSSATNLPQAEPLPFKPDIDATPGPAPSGGPYSPLMYGGATPASPLTSPALNTGLMHSPMSPQPAFPHPAGAPGSAPEPGNYCLSQQYPSKPGTAASSPIPGPAPDHIPRKFNIPLPGPVPEGHPQQTTAQHNCPPSPRSPSPQPYPQYQLSPSQHQPHHPPSAVQYTVSGPTTSYPPMAYQPFLRAPHVQQGVYPQQRYLPPQGYQQPVVVPSGPTTPVGYVLTDLFNRFNTLTLIPSIDLLGRSLAVYRSVLGSPTVRCGGSYVGKDSQFMVEAVEQGVVVLTNVEHGWVAVTDAKKVFVFKTPYKQGDIMFKFVIRSVSGAVVAFESLKFPGHYLSVGKGGLVKLEQHSLKSQNVQFTVRVSKFNGPHSRVITSPFVFGKLSIINQLKERSVIQLYHKPTMTFLCLIEGGIVKGVQKEEYGTFLIYCDRGMGRVSLKGYHRDLLKLRMTTDEKLSSVGAEDVNGDFYVKENRNGTIQFESVAFPGKYVHILNEQGRKICEFSVFLVDMNRNVGRGKNKTILRYALN